MNPPRSIRTSRYTDLRTWHQFIASFRIVASIRFPLHYLRIVSYIQICYYALPFAFMPLWRFLLWKGMMLGVEYSSRLEPRLCMPLLGHRFRLLSAATSLLDFRQNRCMLLSHFDEPHDEAADATNVELSVEVTNLQIEHIGNDCRHLSKCCVNFFVVWHPLLWQPSIRQCSVCLISKEVC